MTVRIDRDKLRVALEGLDEDSVVFEQAMAELATAGGAPMRAGWLRWEDVRAELA